MDKNRKPTMADVAAHAGVSLSTVSLTFSGAGPISSDMKQRVEQAAKELGYLGPSPQGRALRSGKSNIVGLVINERLVLSLRDPLALRVIDALVEDLGDMGMGVLLIPYPHLDGDDRSLLETAAMDAAVVLRARNRNDPGLAMLRRRGIPFSVMEADAPAGSTAVNIADTDAMVELIQHLQSLGHERIGTVTLPFSAGGETRLVARTEIPDTMWTSTGNRLRAFEIAGVEPTVIVECAASTVAEGIAAGHLALSQNEPPTALVCQSDMIAGGVIVAARELELAVPDELSVTGFDGIDLPWLAPLELTTVRQDGRAKGHLLANAIKRLLAGERVQRMDLPLEFVTGNTTGPK